MAGSDRHNKTAAQEVAALAWAGRQAEAVSAADAALAASGLGAEQALELLELRAESHVALGDLTAAAADAAAMQAIARRERSAAFEARALNAEVPVLIRRGDAAMAATAAAALKAARESGEPALEARSLMHLSAAQMNSRSSMEGALDHATHAVAIF